MILNTLWQSCGTTFKVSFKRSRISIFNTFLTDFVVGAPHEDSGTGVIYIYHGGIKGPRREVSQRIVGKELRPDIQGFGISFSRSLDIDGNKYSGKSNMKRQFWQILQDS